ncbi:MAG: hypothetical protein VKN72_11925 [Nostocales cyanobacterium 94392]|nr:hypothetical protein [Nostocales cyanobacterium 94392]
MIRDIDAKNPTSFLSIYVIQNLEKSGFYENLPMIRDIDSKNPTSLRSQSKI